VRMRVDDAKGAHVHGYRYRARRRLATPEACAGPP